MKKGKKAYGHGLRVHDDTRTWGTEIDSWTEMGLEEALDLNIYLSMTITKNSRCEKAREEVDKQRKEQCTKNGRRAKAISGKIWSVRRYRIP